MPGFSPMQEEYFRKATHRWNVKSGATRSGKTYMDYYLIPKRIRAVAGKSGLVVLLGNTKGTLQRNIIDPLQLIWGERLVSSIRSDNTAVLFGEKCYCLGADKINQVDRLRGSSIKYCYGDEVVTWHEDVFSMLKSRLDREYSIFDGTCNPEGADHWFKEFLDSNADIYCQNYTIYDNPFNPPEFVRNLEKEYDGTVYFDRYIKGLWVNAEGLVYPMWNGQLVLEDYTPSGWGEWYISGDYGTVNPCSLGLWWVNDDMAVRVDEYYFDSRKRNCSKTDEEHYEALEELAGDRDITYVIVDPSAASFIETIRRYGRFAVKRADNNVLDGIRRTATLMNRKKIYVTERCTGFLSEIRKYSWNPKAKQDEVLKENDHAMDDTRYLVNTILRKTLLRDTGGDKD